MYTWYTHLTMRVYCVNTLTQDNILPYRSIYYPVANINITKALSLLA